MGIGNMLGIRLTGQGQMAHTSGKAGAVGTLLYFSVLASLSAGTASLNPPGIGIVIS